MSNISNRQLDREGAILISESASSQEKAAAQTIVNDWRASYSLPLRATYAVLRRSALETNSSAVVSRRLKRMESIVRKLHRGQDAHGKLSRMQDIGGCRAVLGNIADVRSMIHRYCALVDSPSYVRCDNYIDHPKVDGYRGVHFVLQYHSDTPRYSDWNGKKIEIQLRTALQHAWSTSVETVDLFSGQDLKNGGGDPKWKRFFALASTVFALQEDAPIVPETSSDLNQLGIELGALWIELDVLHKMVGWSRTVHSLEDIKRGNYEPSISQMSTFLVVMDVDRHELVVTPYSNEEMVYANSDYIHAEQTIRDGRKGYAVLVSVSALEQLRDAYPNFYGDTTRFVREISSFLGSGGIVFTSQTPHDAIIKRETIVLPK